MILTKSENLGILGTILVHALLISYLMLFGFEKKESKEEEGLLVNFGNIDEAAGLFEPAGEAAEPIKSEPLPVLESSETDKELISQDQEKSVSLTEKKKKDADLNQRKLEDQAKLKELQNLREQEQKAAAIRSQAASAFGKGTGSGSSQGSSTSGSGNQGMITGGSGYGQFSLNGRSIHGGLPRPSYAIQEEGTVVVQIIVNPKGAVTNATIALKGTNTDNAALRSAALSAAKQARFNAIEGNQVQSGTITYHFRLK